MRYFSSKSVCRNLDSAVVLLRANLMIFKEILEKFVEFLLEVIISKRPINMILCLKKFSRSKIVKIKIMITKAAIKLDIQKRIIGNSNKRFFFLLSKIEFKLFKNIRKN
ncbi:hypothetical protein BpHYR1_054241 [Brachionus plicatilis]|uniref:Uncharacterized protein n=1 Tax=Brachionus plicatilis TaxID=10195 RepID=A0A3M7SKI7_BRAPC|nr:hypothetical protein BpHYR1_054241 [Brachionus plicatilis]